MKNVEKERNFLGAFVLALNLLPSTSLFASNFNSASGNGLEGIGNTPYSLRKVGAAFDAALNHNDVRDYLSSNEKSRTTIVASGLIQSPALETVKFQQMYGGLEVKGGHVFVHNDGLSSEVIADDLSRFDLDTAPTLSAMSAGAIALSQVKGSKMERAAVLEILPDTITGTSAKLVYRIAVREPQSHSLFDIYVDAHSGAFIAEVPYDYEIAPVVVKNATLGCQEIDKDESGDDDKMGPKTLDPEKCPVIVDSQTAKTTTDQAGINAAKNAAMVLQYFLKTHGRNSFDNRGAPAVSIVHVGKRWANAFWSSEMKIMAYGDGDGEHFGSMTTAADVAGHEMTHGVVSQTSNLMYISESGALNEAFADYFGIQIANAGKEWELGKDLSLNRDKPRGIRRLDNPSAMKVTIRGADGTPKSIPYPDNLSKLLVTNQPCQKSANDNCYVHINSTIIGHLFYKLHQKLGAAALDKLVYLTMTQLLSETSNFRTMAKRLAYGCSKALSSNTCAIVEKELAASGF